MSPPSLTRRDLLQVAAAVPVAQSSDSTLSAVVASRPTKVKSQGGDMPTHHVDPVNLPPGVRSRRLAGINGLEMHVLEAGSEAPGRPAVLLLHGFPDLAYSWRRTMVPLAEAGYHVIAPDQRGYGETTGWDNRYDGDVASFRTHSFALDAMRVVFALGHRWRHTYYENAARLCASDPYFL